MQTRWVEKSDIIKKDGRWIHGPYCKMGILVEHSHDVDEVYNDMAGYSDRLFIKIEQCVEVEVASKEHAKERGWMYYGCFVE